MNIKKIPNEYFVTILDRLTRFEPAYSRYRRVYSDLISKYASGLKPVLLSIEEQSELANLIINNSVDLSVFDDFSPIMLNLEEKYFIKNDISYQYLSNSINIKAIFKKISVLNGLPKNILWFSELEQSDDIYKNRINKSLLFPIEKILLCEGETERVLLPTLLNLFGINLDSLGILLVPAGGKNQVARKLYSMIEYTKLPFIILLDKDAMLINDMIQSKLREIDKVYVINSGEFEDLIPVQVLEGAINYIHKNEYHCLSVDFKSENKMVINLETIYKKYGFGEFKKAHFAHELQSYISKYCSREDFINSEIADIAKLFYD